MSKAVFSQYTVEYISGAMSLRKPQKESLVRLSNILNHVELNKSNDIMSVLKTVNSLYPTCTSFERKFMSMTFALATGVGKTRLMGAFIAYLYTQKGIRNFFVVAPGTTVYEKLINDLGNPGNPKYVFKGLGCFVNPPNIITGSDYLHKQIGYSDINIYVFNIDKFNKESSKMRAVNEQFGESFYSKLSSLPDLVMIMDESHHYRAEQGAAALDELNPVMGLELTATPAVMKNNKAILFKNVVYEYPLSCSIADGYTRTPYAMARTDLKSYNFGEEQIDKLMLADGIQKHENYKLQLRVYAENNGREFVKPFTLVVCKNTAHANWVEQYIKSNEFFDGRYKNKTIVVHSKQRGAAEEANLRALLSVERADNPVEIVIHVDKLKEGWDVNNLYTIIPLRTAASKVLREQMVGRGLRLPYGERVGDDAIDSVTLTAHDKFADIIKEAEKGNSIFKAGNIIINDKPEEPLKVINVQQAMFEEPDIALEDAYERTNFDKSDSMDSFFNTLLENIKDSTNKEYAEQHKDKNRFEPAPVNPTLSEKHKQKIVKKVIENIQDNRDLIEIYTENENSLFKFIEEKVDVVYKKVVEKYIPIPRIKITDDGVEDCCFIDFELDVTIFRHVPVQSSIIIQNLGDLSDRRYVEGDSINFSEYIPARELLNELRKFPEVDYERYSELIQKLIRTVISHYESEYGTDGMKNVIMMNKKDITRKIYDQMMQHFYIGSGLILEEVIGVCNANLASTYTYKRELSLYDAFEAKDIKSILFHGIKYGVFDKAKFDSKPERDFAVLLEHEGNAGNVIQWLRPASNEFNITYNKGHRYEPDFVVETKDVIYLVEIKGEDKINSPDVLSKKARSVKYCETVTAWNSANGYKPWKHIFIPSLAIEEVTSLESLCSFYEVK